MNTFNFYLVYFPMRHLINMKTKSRILGETKSWCCIDSWDIGSVSTACWLIRHDNSWCLWQFGLMYFLCPNNLAFLPSSVFSNYLSFSFPNILYFLPIHLNLYLFPPHFLCIIFFCLSLIHTFRGRMPNTVGWSIVVWINASICTYLLFSETICYYPFIISTWC
jgi:hypothetical protein